MRTPRAQKSVAGETASFLNSSGELNWLASGVAPLCPLGCNLDKLVRRGYPLELMTMFSKLMPLKTIPRECNFSRPRMTPAQTKRILA